MVRQTKSAYWLLGFASATHKICLLATWGLQVRHTPPFGHPSPRGDGYAVHFYAYYCIKRLDTQAATAPSPLGEGCPKGGGCRTRKPSLAIQYSQSITRNPTLAIHHSQSITRNPPLAIRCNEQKPITQVIKYGSIALHAHHRRMFPKG